MKRLSIGVALALFAVGLPGQDLPQWVLSLSKIKRQAKAELLRVPNYACRETVNRFRKTPKDPSFKLIDTLRLEVAFINGKEMFAPAGAAQFQDLDISAFASTGTLGTGAFTAVSRNLFVNDGGRTTGSGEEKLGDRGTLWYGFDISQMFHAYKLSSGGGEAFVGQRGKFWVDAATLELLRIEDHAFDIPEFLDMRDVITTINFDKVKIGPALVLLPQVAETITTDLNGAQSKNVIEFSACREYGSESVIHFGPDESAPKPPLPPAKK